MHDIYRFCFRPIRINGTLVDIFQSKEEMIQVSISELKKKKNRTQLPNTIRATTGVISFRKLNKQSDEWRTE